jgi:hypothetical protein
MRQFALQISEEDLSIILLALEAQETKCKTIGNAGITGYGTTSEKEKRAQWREKACEYRELQTRLSEQSLEPSKEDALRAALESIAEIRPVNHGGREACFALAVKTAQTALYELGGGHE